MLHKKKSFQEITSQVMILGIVVIISTLIFFLAKSYINNNISEKETSLQKVNLENLNSIIEDALFFNNSRRSFILNFNKGVYYFKNNEILYQSEVKKEVTNSNMVCENSYCEYVKNNVYYMLINLTYLNTSLSSKSVNLLYPGVYTLIFTNQNGEITLNVES